MLSPQASPSPCTRAFVDLETRAQVELAAPWAKAVIKITAGPCRGTFLAFECPVEARAWAEQQGARD